MKYCRSRQKRGEVKEDGGGVNSLLNSLGSFKSLCSGHNIAIALNKHIVCR